MAVRDPDGSTPVRRADLDHVRPWPDGATTVANFNPVGRRWHNHKTSRSWTVHRARDGTVTWRHRRHGWTIRLAPPRRDLTDVPDPGPPRLPFPSDLARARSRLTLTPPFDPSASPALGADRCARRRGRRPRPAGRAAWAIQPASDAGTAPQGGSPSRLGCTPDGYGQTAEGHGARSRHGRANEAPRRTCFDELRVRRVAERPATLASGRSGAPGVRRRSHRHLLVAALVLLLLSLVD